MMSKCVRPLQRFRMTVYPDIHEYKQAIHPRLYAKYTMFERESICIVDRDLCEVQDMLRDMGFSFELIAAWKRFEDGRPELGSYVLRDGLFHPMQLHIHLFLEEDGRVLLAGHREYSWIRHPVKHYRADYYSPRDGREAFLPMLREYLGNDYEELIEEVK